MAEHVRSKFSPYASARDGVAFLNLFLALSGYGTSIVAIYFSLTNQFWIGYALASVMGALFLIKIFTIQHDCGHRSMFSSQFLNTTVGTLCSIVVTMPFVAWKKEHDIHHRNVGNIEAIGLGDVPTLTVEMYRKQNKLSQWYYRTVRNPFFFLILAPFLYFFLITKVYNMWLKSYALSTILTNLVVLGIFGTCAWLFGFWNTVLTYGPTLYLGGIAGLALFYLQHNFPQAHWFTKESWSYEAGSLEASSLIILPQPLEWFSHAIGYHDVHHLHTGIPGYRLREAYDGVPEAQQVSPLTWRDVVTAFNQKLWSFEAGRMVTFREAETLAR